MKQKNDIYMKKIKRTIRKEKRKDFSMVLFCIFLLPYTCALLFGGTESTNRLQRISKADENGYVVLDKAYGKQKISLQEYLIGAAAASIPGDYETETIKAQVVILRTDYYANGEKKEDLEISGEQYLNWQKREILWGTNAKEYEEKFVKAVEETEGIVMYCEGSPFSPPYFRLSNGNTRGEKSTKFPWLISVSCQDDKVATEYYRENRMSKMTFFSILENEGIQYPENGKIAVYSDDYEYVKQVEIGSTKIEGETFREYFHLPSLCFSLKEEQDEIIIASRGIGHGFGFCQYSGNEMAKQGEDFLSILRFFFQNIDIQKTV
ncbi:MAG: SpoIID/LytB domain-containing protein [Lachnospiraceae bacterium]